MIIVHKSIVTTVLVSLAAFLLFFPVTSAQSQTSGIKVYIAGSTDSYVVYGGNVIPSDSVEASFISVNPESYGYQNLGSSTSTDEFYGSYVYYLVKPQPYFSNPIQIDTFELLETSQFWCNDTYSGLTWFTSNFGDPPCDELPTNGGYPSNCFGPPDGEYSCLGAFSLLPGMDWACPVASVEIEIIEARMVSKNELGIDLKLTVPDSDPEGGPWNVKFSADINGKSFTTRDFNLSDLLDPGDTDKEIRFDYGLDDRIIDLEYYEVPRFATNQKFELTAVFTGPNSEVEDTAEVAILLPVVIIHGVTKNLFEDTLYFVPYSSLQEFLKDEGYNKDDSWYKTLWGPPGVHFSSQEDTADEVAEMLSDLIDEIVESTYADKVNIIGHSLGGLIGRYYAWYDSERIHKVIMIGTPSEGSSWFYIYAYGKSAKWVEKKLHTSDEQANLRNWLCPTYPCLYDINDNTYIPNTFPNLFHQDGHDKPAPDGVTYYSIYSSQLQTPYELYVRPIKRGEWYKYVKPPLSEEWGDGTVLNESAITYAYNIEVPFGGGHGFLPANSYIQATVLMALNDGD